MKKFLHYTLAVLLLALTLFVPASKSFAGDENDPPPGDEYIRFEDISHNDAEG